MRPPKVQQPRMRRACLGELIQIDGCEHRWFEERTGVSDATASGDQDLLDLNTFRASRSSPPRKVLRKIETHR